MRRILSLTLAVVTILVVYGPTRTAHAGTKARTTCVESFARWHTDIDQPEGGYVTLDYGSDGVDHTTTVWNTPGTGTVGLGARYPGTSILVRWHAADGTVLDVHGKGVAVTVEACDTPTTTTPPVTTVPPVSTVPVPPTAPPDSTVPVPVPTSTPSTPTLPSPVPSTVPDDPAPVPSTTPAVSTSVGPRFPVELPETGPPSVALLAVLAGLVLGCGLLIRWFARH